MLALKKILLLCLTLLVFKTAQGQAKLTEKEKIEALIEFVQTSKNITFIRNGDEYSPEDAASHMQKKWDWLEDDIKTARDFIEKAASKSSVSGKKYQVRLADGKVIFSSEFLLAKLKKIETKQNKR